MAIQLTTTESKYFSEIKNGPLFDQNLGDFGTHLKGNLGERIKAQLTVQVSWRFDITKYTITNANTITITSGSFFTEGFSIGDTANITQRGVGGTSLTFTITSISTDGKQMVTSGAALVNGSFGNSTFDVIRGLTPLEGLKYKFNFIPNDATSTFISSIDETTLSYKADGIRTASPAAVVSTWDDTILGSQTGNHQVTFDNDISDGGIVNVSNAVVFPINSIQKFTIEHEFILFPYFLDGEVSNLETLVRPERIQAGISLKHVVDFEFRSTLSNPNTAKTGRFDNVLGQTSYFDENFGDEATQYSIDSVVLTRGVDVVTGVDAGDTTNVSFSVLNSDGATNPFLTTQPAVAYVSLLPELDAYNASTSVFTDNFIYESYRGLIDAAPSSGTIINNLDIDLISTTQIDVSFDIIYSAGQQALIDEGDNYLIAFGVGDDALTTDLSNKSILKVNLSEYIKDTDVVGLMEVTKLEVYTHPMTFTDGVSQGYTGYKGWVQDGIMWDWAFSLDRTLSAVLERFRVRLVALNTADDTFFPLEDVEYNLSGQIVTPETPTTQQIEIDETRGFDLVDGSIFNLKTFTTGAYSAPDQTYTGQTAFKVNWQEWLSLPDADTIFYDPAEPNNGLNQKASQYSLKEGYEIRLLIDADVSVDGATVTNYIFKSPDATVLDFEEQDGSPISWTSIKETFDTDGANLNQEILTNEDTEVKFTFTPDATPGLASLYWGIIRIEEANQPGVAICELSTFRESKANNILKPLAGESYSKLSLNASVLCLECAIDYTKLNPAKSYNVYGRMGLSDQTPIVPATITSEVDITLTEGAQTWMSVQQTEIMASIALEVDLFGVPLADLNFRTSSVEPGSDQTVRTNWNGGGVVDHGNGSVGFAAMIAVLGAQSTYYYFIEASTTGYVEAGVVLTYEKLGSAVQPQTVVVNFPTTSINNDFVIWFDKRVHITNLTPSQLSSLTLELRTTDAATEDWTDCANTSTATFNTAVDGLGAGTKMACQFHGFRTTAAAAGSLQFDVEYIDDVDNEQAIVATPNAFNGEWRPFDNPNGCIAFDKSNDAVNLGSGIMTQFMAIDNPFTMEYWFEASDLSAAAFQSVLSNTSTTSPQKGVAVSITGNDIQYQLRSAAGEANLFRVRWDYNSDVAGGILSNVKYHMVITYDGSATTAGVNCYLNGRRLTTRILELQNIPAATVVTPNGTVMCHSSYQASATPTFAAANTNKSAILRIYDTELSNEDLRALYLDITYGATHTDLIRDYDFSNVTTTTITDLTANENGTLVNHATDTSTTFY